ncbi:MAG: DUF202 domain-containing protein [Waddliaceae bacterium]
MVDLTIEEKELTSVLANERTYNSWQRTGLTGLVTGLAVERFLGSVMPFSIMRTTSMILLFFSILCFILGAWRYQHVGTRIPTFKISGAPELLLVITSAFLSFASILAIIGLWMFSY